MASLDLTSFDSALKQHYTADRVEMMVYRDHPLLALMPKYERFGGKNLPIPIWYGIPAGRSATFATAKANKAPSKFEDFVLTRNKDYALASIDNETLEASKGNSNAFLEAAASEIDGAFLSITRSLATAMYRDGSGTIGRVSNSGFATDQLQLTDPNEVVNFEVGMQVQFSSAGTTASLRDSGATLTVNAVDRDTGILTMSANLSTITGIAQNDFINVEGDIEIKVKGLDAWVPSVAPTGGDNFFGVDRSLDATRLGGNRIDGTGKAIEEALVDGAARVAREGGAPNYCFMNYDKFAELEKSLGSKVQYVDVKASAEIGFRGIMIHGPRGPIRVVADQNCPDDVAHMLDLSMWKLYSIGKAPKILSQDGLRLLRESDDDAVEVRVGYYAQVGCRAPGFNARISLS